MYVSDIFLSFIFIEYLGRIYQPQVFIMRVDRPLLHTYCYTECTLFYVCRSWTLDIIRGG